MIGNDVVDLRDPETQVGAPHPRFDARVFTADERRGLRLSPVPNRTRWLMWAAKESAFKALRRTDARIAFRPRGFVVTLWGATGGVVRYHDVQLSFRIHATDRDVLHVVALGPGAQAGAVTAGVDVVGTDAPGTAARRMLLGAVARWVGVDLRALDVVQADRMPCVRLHGVPLPVVASLSHHGRFAAFACAPRSGHCQGRVNT